MLNNFHSARESGSKSLKAAEEAGNVQQQLQACVLVGLAEGKEELQWRFVMGTTYTMYIQTPLNFNLSILGVCVCLVSCILQNP